MEREPFDASHEAEEPVPREQSLRGSADEQQDPTANRVFGEQYARQDAQERPEDENPGASMIRSMAQITAQGFQSSQEAMNAALEVIGRFLDCETLYVARFELREPDEKSEVADAEKRLDRYIWKAIAVLNKGVSYPVVGDEEPLNEMYCQTILQSRQPLIIDDVERYPFYQKLAVTEKRNISSYLGVPLIYSDGRIYGSLCSRDSHTRPLFEQPEKLELMLIVARFLISHIEREELIAQVRAAERAQATLAMKEQQARVEADLRVRELEAIFEAMGDGVLVCDQHGQFKMNAAARSIFPADLPQGNVPHLSASLVKALTIRDEAGRDLPVGQCPVARVLRGEHLIGAEAVTLQYKNKAGEVRYLNVAGMPIYDQQGQVSGGVCLYRDVTEHYLLEQRRKETLTAMLALAELLALLPESAMSSLPPYEKPSDLVFACGRLKQLIETIMECQDVWIISFAPETASWHLKAEGRPAGAPEPFWWQEVSGIFQSASFGEGDVDRLNANEIVMHTLQSREETGAPLFVGVPMVLGNRLLGVLALVYLHHEATLAPAEYDLAKAIGKLVGVMAERDRLLQEQAEIQAHTLALQESDRRFNEFLSIASHELKGPLTVFKSNIQLAQRALRSAFSNRAQEDEAVSGALQRIQRHLGRMEQQTRVQERLANDLLDVVRIHSNKLELHMQPCDVGQIVREIVEDQRQITEGRTIKLELPDDSLMVYGDEDRLGQVVHNYLTNALKYSEASEPVEVVVMVNRGEVRVVVSDQGEGLTLEEQGRIWERFYRVKDMRVRSGSGIGLGLGLHICKTIVEQHGGGVGLNSIPGIGSSFWFTLPLSEDETGGAGTG